MAVTASQIDKIINNITKHVEQAYDGLSLFFVVHKRGEMRESLALAEHEIISHPAGNAGRSIIRKHNSHDNSSFLGLGIHAEKKMLGFKKTDHVLGIFNVNINEFKDTNEARAKIYHLAWHAIDLFEIRQRPQYRNKFSTGPMVPKRSAINFTKASLQADVFAVAFAGLLKEKSLLNFISRKRAQDALNAKDNHRPESFASVIAMDACESALEEFKTTQILPKDFIINARQLSVDVGHTFNEESIRQWWNFTIPAQDMAWRGLNQEKILGAAIHTSSDPYVRSIGYLIQEVLEIEPELVSTSDSLHNAFIDKEILSSLHKEMVDTIFEDAVSQGLQESSNRPFLNAANKLNEALTDGHILGWCSNALHDAAQAFERALLNGAPPDQAARMQFEGNKAQPKWESLKELGKGIIDQKRKGFAVTMGHIAEICHNNPSFAPVLDSLKITMNDPAYIQKLEAANDLNIMPNAPTITPKTPAPNAPIPRAPAPNAPIPQSPAMSPSLGGNNRGQQLAHQRNLAIQKMKDNAQGTGDEQS